MNKLLLVSFKISAVTVRMLLYQTIFLNMVLWKRKDAGTNRQNDNFGRKWHLLVAIEPRRRHRSPVLLPRSFAPSVSLLAGLRL
jgi:hypothetical protein